jgi:hypothetical protein
MEIIVTLAGLILVAVFFFDRERLQVDLSAIGKFLKIVLIGSALSFVIRYSLGRIPTLPPVGFGSLLLVWWEDVLFSLLSIYYAEKFLPKWVFVPLAVITSLVFGMGHLYQGWFAVLALSFYPYFVSYKCGKKYGYGTVMICHVLYDVIVCGCSLLLSKALV